MDATAGTPTITSNSDAFHSLSIDNGGTTLTFTLEDALDVNGNLLIDTSNTLDAKSGENNNVSVAGNFTNNGTYTARSNLTTLDGAVGSTQVITGTTTFYQLSASVTGGHRTLQFAASTTYTISNNINLSGNACDSLLIIRSGTANTQFTIANSDASPTAIYLDVKDSAVTGTAISSSSSVNSGNNTNWTIAAGSCEGTGTSTATAYSFQRKTFYDATNSRHWMFHYDGTSIVIKYSSNEGSTWTGITHLNYNTNDFSVWNTTISGTAYVWIALTNSDDIKVLRGTLSTTNISWDNDIDAALDGTSASDTHAYPYITSDSSNYLWVGARNYNGSKYVYKAVKSAHTGDTDFSTLTWGTASQISDDQTNANVYGNIVSTGSQNMYATFVSNTALEGCRWVNASSAWQDSSGSTCSVTAGSGGEDTYFDSLTTNLVGHWKMNEASWNGTTDQVVDSSTSSFDGTSQGSATTTGSGFSRSGTFDGTGDYVSMGDNLDIVDTTDFTLSAWVNRSAFTADDQIIAKRTDEASSAVGYTLWIDGDGADDIRFEVSDVTSNDEYLMETTAAITTTGWHHIVVVWDDDNETNTAIYVDGVKDVSSRTGTFANINSLANSEAFAVSGESDGGELWDGQIDDVRVYNRALMYEEVTRLYQLIPESVMIGDASDLGPVRSASPNIVRTSTGTLYAVVSDAEGLDRYLEVWKSTDGINWAEQDTANNPQTDGVFITYAVAIDSANNLHLSYLPGGSTSKYIKFTTSTDTFGSVETPVSSCNNECTDHSIAVDANDVPHVVIYNFDDGGFQHKLIYSNRIGGSWGSEVSLEGVAYPEMRSPVITIDEDNIPEISYYNVSDSDLTAAVGQDNDPDAIGQWSLYDIDTLVDTAGSLGIAVDTSTGNTWLSYKDSGGTIALAKRTDGSEFSSWSTGWSTVTTKTDIGEAPYIAIAESSDIYVFYSEDSTDRKLAYDIYDSNAGSPAWAGETILQTPPSGVDYFMKPKWSFEWNNYGPNRIDYLYDDGTDTYYNHLFLRRPPTNIDNASDFGGIYKSGRQVVRSSTGVLYSFNNDGGSCEIWSSSDGINWTERDSANNPDCDFVGGMAIDGSDVIHLTYVFTSPNSDLKYMPFATSTNTFTTGSAATIMSGGTDACLDAVITVDSNNVPHAACTTEGSFPKYVNKVGGSWNTPVIVESSASASSIDITINDGNFIEIAYINTGDSDLTGAISTSNNPTAEGHFTKHDIDTSVNIVTNEQAPSLGVNTLTGDTWVAYKDSGGAIALAKHTGSTWTTDWSTITTKTDVGFAPSIAIDRTNIYVFYEDDQDDIVYDKYNGTIWSGETVLEMHGALQGVKAKWSFLENNDSTGTHNGGAEIDYLYSDGTDVFYNRLALSGLTPGTQDAIDTTLANISDNFSAVGESGTVHLVFVDDESTDQISYKKWNGTSWSSAVLVADAADADDAYVSLSLDITNNNLYALWIDTVDSDIFYSSCATSTNCDLASEWAAETAWKTTGTNTYVTSNYSGPSTVFAEWTTGSTSPYTVNWDVIVAIPENLWLLMLIAPLLPKALRRRWYDKKKYKKLLRKLFNQIRNKYNNQFKMQT